MAAVALAVLGVVILAGSLTLYALTRQNLVENGGQAFIVFTTFVTVGLIIAWHRPGNPIGWLILAGVDVQGLAIAGSVYMTLASRPGYHLPVGPLVWLDSSWFVGVAVLPLVILLFPDGRPPSRRWRRVMWSYVAMVGCYGVCTYAAVIIAIAGHRTRIDANGTPAFLNHLAGWYAAALFSPLRSRVQRIVDRRFNRARYDADRTVTAFAARLKDAVDLDSVCHDLTGMVTTALEPAHVSLWLSERQEEREDRRRSPQQASRHDALAGGRLW